ncbi:hypothetical protein NX801_29855 [Streptomyces sp. LP05-1]|uniref:Uncharacterized protein n=1 Tax=Streptomyces pyxinae TaxID=2970734 RepID=A0ABT2CQR7_9ACTN|nr:hypothetical protein [Streptomyces sp. LP05-1]MCS0639768.1 hypothetical protein [Streptomyces sp. LP05-1]
MAGGGPEGPSQDSCPLRDWGCVSGVRRPSWQLLSSHRTSEGEVEYCRCSCAALVVLHRGELASFTCPPDDPAGALPPGGGVPGGPPSP